MAIDATRSASRLLVDPPTSLQRRYVIRQSIIYGLLLVGAALVFCLSYG